MVGRRLAVVVMHVTMQKLGAVNHMNASVLLPRTTVTGDFAVLHHRVTLHIGDIADDVVARAVVVVVENLHVLGAPARHPEPNARAVLERRVVVTDDRVLERTLLHLDADWRLPHAVLVVAPVIRRDRRLRFEIDAGERNAIQKRVFVVDVNGQELGHRGHLDDRLVRARADDLHVLVERQRLRENKLARRHVNGIAFFGRLDRRVQFCRRRHRALGRERDRNRSAHWRHFVLKRVAG